MILSKTPYRISLFGGGTDFPDWYLNHGGAVISSTIDKYCYISCRTKLPFFEHKYRFVYSSIENVSAIKEIKHPAIRGVFEWYKIDECLEVHHDGDLPARSGLGSSSAFTVGLLNVLGAQKGEAWSKQELASCALHVEQNVIGEPCGSQDQVAVAFGGLNKIEFHTDGKFHVKPLTVGLERVDVLNNHLLLFFTGTQRYSSDIETEKIKVLDKKTAELYRMFEMVDESIEILTQKVFDYSRFGKLLHESWLLKRGLVEGVSNTTIDEAYGVAMKNGAIGGKILGAGGGGFLIMFAEPKFHQTIIDALSGMVHVPFKFEQSGSHISALQKS
jgi:D-glycero-alpha-D-manno-heptose-7-phosphate kinase